MPLLSDEEVGLAGGPQSKLVQDADVGLPSEDDFKITPETYGQIAAARIERLNQERLRKTGERLSQSEQAAVLDAWRLAAGLEPISSKDVATPFYAKRQARTEADAVANFEANFANTTLSFMGGFTQAGYRLSDLAGITEGASQRFAQQQAEMGAIMAPGGGVSGFAGRAVGNLANVALLGGLTPAAGGAAPTLGGRLVQQLPVAGAFGASSAGSTVADIEQRRAEGEQISGGQEFLAALGNAAAETVTEMFGQEILHSVGRALAPRLPAILQAARAGKPKALARAIVQTIKSTGGEVALASVGGGVEEATAELLQNIASKLTYDPKRSIWGDLGEAFLQGAVMPLPGGAWAAIQARRARGGPETAPTGPTTGPIPGMPVVPGTEALPAQRAIVPSGGPLATIARATPIITPPGDRPTYSQPGERLPRQLVTFPPEGSIQMPAIIDLIEHAPPREYTPGEVVEYVAANHEPAAEAIRPILGDGAYVRRDVPISQIEPNILSPDEVKPERVSAITERREMGEAPRPIVVAEDGSIADGLHRYVEAVEQGEQTISALVPKAWAETHDLPAPTPDVVPTDRAMAQHPEGFTAGTPTRTYAQAVAGEAFGPSVSGHRNPWVRPARTKNNKNRVLLVQFSTNLINADRPKTSADAYYDKLYQRRSGYTRPSDFWEIPQWIGVAAKNLPNADVYVVRDLAEAAKFLQQAGYGEVAFSALDVNSKLIQQLIDGYQGKVAIGGYTDMAPFTGRGNVATYEAMPDWIKAQGRPFVEGTDYRHFKDTEVVPRLCLSKGCLHKCAFCGVAGKGKPPTEVSKKAVDAQVKSFRDLKARLVYIDDKTFGQAKNHQDLIEINQRLRADNPNFEGFVVQTSAAQMQKIDPQFLKDADIRYVELGVESYNDAILKAMHKPANEAMIDKAVAKIREAGATFIPNVMIGLPGETTATYKRTLDFLKANADVISHVNAYNVAVYEGSELAETIGKAQTAADLDENVTRKSWQQTPEVDQAFHDAVMEFASQQLDRDITPTPEQAATAAQAEMQGLNDDAPPAEPLPGMIEQFLEDDAGAISFGPLIQAARGIGAPVARMVNDLTGEMAMSVAHTQAGRVLVGKLDNVATKAKSLVGAIENRAAAAYKQLTRKDRRWLSATDGAGYSNFQRLLEDTPSGKVAAPNPRIQAMLDVYQHMIDVIGLEAVRVRVQAISPDGKVVDFKQASTGRFLRNLTPDAFAALMQGHGPLFDAIAAAVARDNPNVSLVQAGEFLREWMGPESVRKIGQIERLRAIRFLPSSVNLGGNWIAIQETDPYIAVMGNAKRQAKRIYFIEEFGQNIKGQQTAVEALRADHAKHGGRVGDFDDILTVFEGRPYKRVFQDPRNPAARAIKVVDTLVSSSQTSLSAVPNLPQTLILTPKYVGIVRFVRAVGEAIAHPRQTAAQLAAMGAMNRSVIDWTVRPGHGPEDVARMAAGTVARVTGLEALSQFNNMVAGGAFRRLADSWRQNGISSGDMAVARDLRLTPAEIDAINRSQMPRLTYNKIVQNGVSITQFITEDPHRMSKFQHIPLLNGLFAYNNYAIGTAKAVARTARETALAFKPGATPAQRAAAAYRLVLLMAGSVGAGTISLLLRRAVKGQPIIREDDDIESIVTQALWEVSLLGPTQRMQDAFDFSGGSTEKAMIGLSPKLTALVEVVNTLRGGGRWGELPVGERAQKTVTKLSPLIRSLENWYARAQYPQTELYGKVRSMAGAYRPRTSPAPEMPVKAPYYHIHQAILRGDEDALQAGLMEFDVMAKEQGWDADTARRNLRSALSAKRPVNFNVADYREFLASLSPEKRHLVEVTQAHYTDALDRLTLPPEDLAASRGDVDTLRRMVTAGEIGEDRAREVLRKAKAAPLENQLASADFDATLRVWATASPAERDAIRPRVLDKAKAAIRRRPVERDRIFEQLRNAGVIR